jgi:hypothetical protein
MRIVLDPGELAVAHQVAALRQYVNAGAGLNGTRSRRDGGTMGSQVSMHTLGFIAELAWAKWTKVYPDLTARPRVGTPDFVLKNGMTVDIKATAHTAGNLLCSTMSNELGHDVYVLAVVMPHGEVCAVDFIGWALGSEFITDACLKPKGWNRLHEDSYYMAREELRTWEELGRVTNTKDSARQGI